jgi:hypothetical protein
MEQQSGEPQEETPQTWMPTAGGILSIISGAMGLIGIVFLITFGAFSAETARDVLTSLGFLQTVIPLQVIGFISIPLFIMSMVAIIGGIYALQRKVWGLALAGAICAIVLPVQLLGILSVIFIAMSKKEFD